MKRQFCHAKFQKSNQKPIFISQNSIIMETDKCLFALIYIFQKLSGLIYLRNSFRFCVITKMPTKITTLNALGVFINLSTAIRNNSI